MTVLQNITSGLSNTTPAFQAADAGKLISTRGGGI